MATWQEQPQFPLFPGNGFQPHGRGRLAQDSCPSPVGLTGAGCFISMRNGPMEGAGAVCSSSFRLLSCWLQTRIEPSLSGRWESHFRPTARSVWWGQSETPRVTLVQGCSDTASASWWWLCTGVWSECFGLSPNLCNWFRAAIHSRFHGVWIHVMWLWAADITHLKHGALPPVLCSRSWQGWIGQCCTGELAPVAFLLHTWSGSHYHPVCWQRDTTDTTQADQAKLLS